MTEQTQADRREAAQKGAATRRRNEERDSSAEAGHKAAATRQANEARDMVGDAKSRAKSGFSELGSAVKSAGDAAVKAGKSVASRAAGAVRN
jgi:hypothetical protein